VAVSGEAQVTLISLLLSRIGETELPAPGFRFRAERGCFLCGIILRQIVDGGIKDFMAGEEVLFPASSQVRHLVEDEKFSIDWTQETAIVCVE
jgi:hypothetical protein